MSSSDVWNSWVNFVPALKQGKHHAILQHITQLRNNNTTVYPSQHQLFRALESILPQDVCVIIIGQDPYHGEAQAHGLAFSITSGQPHPPSLRNIFKEVNADVYDGTKPFFDGDLSSWAKQGVLLLNSILSVEKSKPLSHANLGWQVITKSILQTLAVKSQNLAILLWGNHAQSYEQDFAAYQHLILKAPHPSPLSASRGFLGCKHFSQVNKWLVLHGRKPIIW